MWARIPGIMPRAFRSRLLLDMLAPCPKATETDTIVGRRLS